ncbi:DUF4238 domain-containing protein [Lysobacter sp. CA199]|uniref:DUF4238 domain-containing protein n=1 Tax=Lysobacter sp. CA199 TaxID=3455608 RepID=UPI003F8D088C
MTSHHYVPQWYQRRFLSANETNLHYLNLDPWREVNGRRVRMRDCEQWGTKKCFCSPNLYSVDVPGRNRDLYETLFFGEVDRLGALALDVVASNPARTPINQDHFENFFSYMSAQTLRTPKGLAWLKSWMPGAANHFQIMRGLEQFRDLRCLAWSEGFQDIVYTNDPDAGFIITDHPVTSYNKASYSGAAECRPPNDPGAFWKGTQTIFPLDAKRCLVLTHSEYAHKPDMRAQLKRPRTNPRMYGFSLVATHQIEHREINAAQVAAINLILKKRATRYVAASREEWLFPETVHPRTQWPDLGRTLLPTTALWRNTGETYAQMNDGRVIKADAFGRMPKTLEEQRRAAEEIKRMRAQVERALSNHRARDDD